MGKKHYPIKAHHIKRLITHVEEGGILESHKDVPEAVRDELYREEQQRLEKDKRKGGQAIGTGVPYPPINILNVLPSQLLAPVSGRTVSDNQNWTPNLEVVRVLMRFAIVTG
jgi:hypothetical protein